MSTTPIRMPDILNVLGSLAFSRRLANIKPGEKVIFDFTYLNRAFPFGTLVTSSCINYFKSLYPHSQYDHVGIDTRNNQAHGYLGHIGFFQSIGIDIGRHPGEAFGSDNYIPIRKLTRQEIECEATRASLHAGDIIIRRSDEIARVITHAFYPKDEYLDEKFLFKFSSYSAREIIRNSIEHSESDEVYFSAQYFPINNNVEVAILDNGIGLYNSLISTHNPDSTTEAIRLALEPGISSKLHLAKDDKWGNSGFGLYTTSQLCLFDGGAFAIASDDAAISFYNHNNLTTFYPLLFKGTAVMLKYVPQEDCYFENILQSIVEKGESKAQTRNGTIRASKMSKVVR